jgi:hypothetical protein
MIGLELIEGRSVLFDELRLIAETRLYALRWLIAHIINLCMGYMLVEDRYHLSFDFESYAISLFRSYMARPILSMFCL